MGAYARVRARTFLARAPLELLPGGLGAPRGAREALQQVRREHVRQRRHVARHEARAHHLVRGDRARRKGRLVEAHVHQPAVCVRV